MSSSSLLKVGLAALASVLTAGFAHAVTFTLNASSATIVNGNTVSSFYQVSGGGAESGTSAATFSSVISGQGAVSANDPWTVVISFNGPQPTLASAFIKASNGYLWWDASDLAAFNSGSYTSITLVQNGLINNPGNAYHEISHAGLNGTAGGTDSNTPGVPDGGASVAMLGVTLVGLTLAFRRFGRA